jgi:hypothetical protein
MTQLVLIDLADDPVDFSGKRVLLKLSGGINSAAALCFLAKHHPPSMMPAELHLYYSHLREHSPDTAHFVCDCIRFARAHFELIKWKITRDSVNAYFEQENTIPHPTLSPCSIDLKIKPAESYYAQTACDYLIVGFVRSERRRIARQEAYGDKHVVYPISHMTDDDCFDLVKQCIGWYPAIYDIRWTQDDVLTGRCQPFEKGKRVFSHNNCLPCKNMSPRQLAQVGRHFPEYAQRAMETAARIPGAYWGRDDVPEVFQCDQCTRFN